MRKPEPPPSAPMIFAGIGTEDVKKRMEQSANRAGYRISEWLTLGHNGVGLRVVAEFEHGGHNYNLAFKWNGEDINVLATRCIALDYSMCQMRAFVLSGRATQ